MNAVELIRRYVLHRRHRHEWKLDRRYAPHAHRFADEDRKNVRLECECGARAIGDWNSDRLRPENVKKGRKTGQ
jgi:hypothetical protein